MSHAPLPGLFITGTGTGVGKTVVTCLLADQARRRGRSRARVFKPFATGCRAEGDRLISDDAVSLAAAAGLDGGPGDLDLVNPVRYRDPVAPAVAADAEARPVDWSALRRALAALGSAGDWFLVEGVGGVLTPIEDRRGRLITALDVADWLGLPVVVVCRAGLGTLSETAAACEAIRHAGLRIAGLVVNGFEPGSPDPAMRTNRRWLSRQTGARVLATLPGRSTLTGVDPLPGGPAFDTRAIPETLRRAIDECDFETLSRSGEPSSAAR